MKLWFNKIKNSFSFQEKFFCFAVFGGLLCVKNNCASLCWVNKNGNLGLVSTKSVKPLMKHQNFFLWRGIEFVLYGTYYQIKALFFSAKHQDILFKIKQRNFSRFCKVILQIGCVLGVIFIVILANWLLLGIFPAKLCFWIMGDVENLFMARLLISLIKCFLLFLLFLVCKLLTSVKSVWKVFTASTALLYNQNMYPLNFYNVIFGALLLDVFVVSLCGLNLAMVSGFLVSVLILLVCSGLSFEICLWQSLSKSFFAKAYKLIGLLFYELPNKTEMQIAVGAITECELMIKNEEREGLADFESEQEIPLAFVLGDVRVSLKKAGITDESEAEWLIAGVLGLKRFDLKFVKTLTHKQLNLVQMVLERRINFEPLDKIFGFKEFMGLKFFLNCFFCINN
jgi:hypothetical protein